MKIKTNERAFPSAHYNDIYGMTLRDYFAAKAMQAEICSPNLDWNTVSPKVVAHNAYTFADAMLEYRDA